MHRPILKGHLFLLKVAGNINAHVISYELPINLRGYSCVRKRCELSFLSNFINFIRP